MGVQQLLDVFTKSTGGDNKKRYEIVDPRGRRRRKNLTRDEARDLQSEGFTVTLAEDLDRAKLVEDYEERVQKSLAKGGRKDLGPEWTHGRKWTGGTKTGRSSFATRVLVIHKDPNTGTVRRYYIPRENLAYTSTGEE